MGDLIFDDAWGILDEAPFLELVLILVRIGIKAIVVSHHLDNLVECQPLGHVVVLQPLFVAFPSLSKRNIQEKGIHEDSLVFVLGAFDQEEIRVLVDRSNERQ
jgi:hypothetical protein